MTQCDRVLAWLERHGEVNTVDFMAPNVCDGGKPIIRLAARIYDLRELGHQIRGRTEANGTETYLLDVERSAERSQDPISAPLDTPLFDQASVVASAIGGWEQ